MGHEVFKKTLKLINSEFDLINVDCFFQVTQTILIPRSIILKRQKTKQLQPLQNTELLLFLGKAFQLEVQVFFDTKCGSHVSCQIS